MLRPLLCTTSGASVGRGDHTPPWPGRPTGGCRGTPATFHPPFSFWRAPKRKRRWSRQKKKRWSLRSYGRVYAPSRAAGRGPKPFCSVDAAPTRTRAGLSSDFRTRYAVLHSLLIGQRPDLTSCYLRAFRFAKRCPGSRGAVPLLGWPLRRFPPIPHGRGRGRFAARRLVWVVDWAFRRGRCPHRPVAWHHLCCFRRAG